MARDLWLNSMEHEVWTIGHSTHELGTFVAILKAWDIELLADVRSYPSSRRMPWFYKAELEKSMPAVGIAYQHIAELGGRRKNHADSTNTIWKHPAFRGYADYMMDDPEFEKGLKELKGLAVAQRTCMMCSEVLWWRCHRSMISDRMKADGWKVHHILSAEKEQDHPYTAPAHLVDGRLAYGPAPGSS